MSKIKHSYYRLIYLITLCFLLLMLSACSLPRLPMNYNLRPVSIKVVDSKSNIPLKDISVYQIVDSGIYGGCFDLLVGIVTNNYYYDQKFTDENGLVSFPLKKLDFTCKEYIWNEHIIVNLDLIPEEYEKIEKLFRNSQTPMNKEQALVLFGVSPLKSDQRRLMTINDKYRGYIIYSGEHEMGKDWWQGRQKIFTVDINNKGLNENEQTLIAPLELKNNY
jgi:hypothetical protein